MKPFGREMLSSKFLSYILASVLVVLLGYFGLSQWQAKKYTSHINNELKKDIENVSSDLDQKIQDNKNSISNLSQKQTSDTKILQNAINDLSLDIAALKIAMGEGITTTTLVVSSASNFYGDLSVDGDLTVNGSSNLKNNVFNSEGDLIVDDNLFVTGNSNLQQNLAVGGSLDVLGPTSLSSLFTSGNALIGGNLKILGSSDFGGNIFNSSAPLTVSDSLSQTGSGNQVTFSGNVDANNGLDVSGAALTSSAGLTVSSGGASITGGLNNNSGGITNAGAISGATTGSFSTSATTPIIQNAGTLTLQTTAAGNIILDAFAGSGIQLSDTTTIGAITVNPSTNNITGVSSLTASTGSFTTSVATPIMQNAGILTIQTTATGDLILNAFAGSRIDIQDNIYNSVGALTLDDSVIDILYSGGVGAINIGDANDSVIIEGTAYSQPFLQVGSFIIDPISGTTFGRFTPGGAMTIKRITVQATASGTAATTFRLSNGTVNSDLTLALGTTTNTATFTNNYAAGAAITFSITAAGGTPAARPDNINVIVEYTMQ